MKTNWTLKVTEELNDKTFEAAHKLKISKSEFIRQAVEEKIQGPKGTLKDPYPSVGVPKSSKDYFNSNPEKKPQELTNKEKKLSKKLLGAEISPEYIKEITTKIRREDSYFKPKPKKGKK